LLEDDESYDVVLGDVIMWKKTGMRRDPRQMTWMEHLEELRDRFKVCLISIGVATLIMLAFPYQVTNPVALFSGEYQPVVSVILNFMVKVVKPERMEIIGGTITAPLEIYFIASLIFGLIASSPVVGYEIFKYIDPALYPHERRMIYPFMASFIGLFFVGSVMGFGLITPLTFRAMLIFFDLVGASPVIYVTDFYLTILVVTLATGVVFTSPVILVLLVRVGIISTKTIERNRKWIYGLGYIVAAIITPDGGLFANFILLGFLIVLIESGIFIAKKYEKERAIREKLCPFCGAYMGDEVFCPECKRARL